MNDPEDIFTVGPGMTLLEAYTKAIARVAELESENASLKRTFETWNEWFKQNFKEKP